MKKITLLFGFLVLFAGIAGAAIPNSTFFVGGKLVNRGFDIEYKQPTGDRATSKNSYSGSAVALTAGFRGTYTRVFFDYTFEREYSADDNKIGGNFDDVKYSSYSINAEGFKSFDLLFISIGAHAENITTTVSGVSDTPSGFVFGVNGAAGFFVGQLSGEFTAGYSFTSVEKNDITYKAGNYQGFALFYHI